MREKKQQHREPSGTPPHSQEAEQTVIACILMGDTTLFPLLQLKDFYDPVYREIFETARKVWKEQKSCDFVLLCNALTESRRILQVGGTEFLMRLTTEYAGLPFAESAVRVMKKKRTERETIATGQRVSAMGYDEGRAHEIPAILLEESKRIADLLPREKSAGRDILFDELTKEHATIATGFTSIDMMLSGGLHPGDLFLIAARPGVGKSALATSLSASFLHRGVKHCFFSLEMTRRQIVTRILCAYYNATPEQVRRNAREYLNGIETDIDVVVGMNDLLRIQEEAMASDGDVFIIDYFGLITAPHVKENRFQVMDEISRSMKNLAVHTGKPIIMLTQLNREIEKAKDNREPQLSDLWGAGEKDADVISFLWDPNAKKVPETGADHLMNNLQGNVSRTRIESAENKELMWLVKKHRNGPTGDVELTFLPEKFLMKEASALPALAAKKIAPLLPKEDLPF